MQRMTARPQPYVALVGKVIQKNIPNRAGCGMNLFCAEDPNA